MTDNKLTLALCIVSSLVMGQHASYYSCNGPDSSKTAYHFDFNGTAADNCMGDGGVPTWWYQEPHMYSHSFSGTTWDIVKDASKGDTIDGWHGAVLGFYEDECASTGGDISLDLTAVNAVEIKIHSSVEIKQFACAFYDATNGTWTDYAPDYKSLNVGDNLITFDISKPDFWTQLNYDSTVTTLDRTNLTMMQLWFRTAIDDNYPSGTFKIDYINIGKNNCPESCPQSNDGTTMINNYHHAPGSSQSFHLGDSLKFAARIVNPNDALVFEDLPEHSVLSWEYKDNQSPTWRSILNLEGASVANKELLIDYSAEKHAHNGIFQTQYRYIVNYDTTANLLLCNNLVDTVYSQIDLFCKSQKTSGDTSIFLVNDLRFKGLNEGTYLRYKSTINQGICDSVHYRYHKFIYDSSSVDTCRDLVLDSNFVTIYDTVRISVKVADTLAIYLSSTLSTMFDAAAANTTIKVYPNPTLRNLTVDIDQPGNLEGVSIKILNEQGSVVHQQLVTGSNQYVEVSNWAEGLYLIYIMEGVNTIDVRKIVVKN